MIGKKQGQPPEILLNKNLVYNEKHGVLSKLDGQQFGFHDKALYFANMEVSLESLAQGLMPKGAFDREGMKKQLIGCCQNGNALPFLIFPKSELSRQTFKLQMVPITESIVPEREEALNSGVFKSRLYHNKHEYIIKLHYNSQRKTLVC